MGYHFLIWAVTVTGPTRSFLTLFYFNETLCGPADVHLVVVVNIMRETYEQEAAATYRHFVP